MCKAVVWQSYIFYRYKQGKGFSGTAGYDRMDPKQMFKNLLTLLIRG